MSKKPRKPGKASKAAAQQLPRTTMLADALAKQDTAAVALALRNDRVVVPLLPGVPGDPQVRVFRRGESDKYMLLLFSSPETYVAMVPQENDHRVLGYDAATLADFIEQNLGVLEAVWFDVAGPHAMQAEPAEVLKALRL
ncbi:SseB family protein [Ruicaihuangia caeni]|uniref:SseB family protein n=1 Tax=Ruicaihuangia caeni TaxID=3042517 RepID=A0AAW6T737_9MICO|nr:SseB family protein [Klugiella sp. YN-L-19]MDI2098471.1 SseB family protein [Klugiella sp. YN-L-19]